MRMYDLIMKKRNGGIHTEEEIEFIVSKFTAGEIPDYQMSAWLMCVYYKGMTNEETVAMTKAMAASGDQLDLSAIDGVKVDKHSTGGVGDKTTFIVAPILASLGVPIAKMSGRGLGHTGGTIDKLESIPGFDVAIPQQQFINQVNDIKLSLVGQTGNLTPADKKIYALRDVTAAVDSLPLIASSIMSKKLAAGADVIVLDVKCGSGAFMKDEESARELAKTMVDIGNMAGRKTYGVITDMNEPLGCKVGNALEVMEAVQVLSIKQVDALLSAEDSKEVSGAIIESETLQHKVDDESFAGFSLKGIKRILEVSLTLAAYMYMGAGMETDFEKAKAACVGVIESGAALAKLAEFVKAQGADEQYIYHIDQFELAKYVVPVEAPRSGCLTACNTSEVGMVSLVLGGGRATKDSDIDLGVGVDIRKHLGDSVKTGEVMAYIYANNESVIDEAKKRFINAYTIEDSYKETSKIVKCVVE